MLTSIYGQIDNGETCILNNVPSTSDRWQVAYADNPDSVLEVGAYFVCAVKYTSRLNIVTANYASITAIANSFSMDIAAEAGDEIHVSITPTRLDYDEPFHCILTTYSGEFPPDITP